MAERTRTLSSLTNEDPDEGPPLIAPGEDCGDADGQQLEFGSDGSPGAAGPVPTPAGSFPTVAEPQVLARPCPLSSLNGSWLLQITPDSPVAFRERPLRGPMRIEAAGGLLRVSGDVYLGPRPVFELPAVAPLIGPASLVIQRSWYPAYPQGEYRWYFRSTGCSYGKGVLTLSFERQLWNTATQEFTSVDNGRMQFTCSSARRTFPGLPQPTIVMRGTATIGGQRHLLTATKTSSLYRGCQVEVDVMANRAWPASATSCDGQQMLSFTQLYRAAGMDFRGVVHEVDMPEAAPLTTASLHSLLAGHRGAGAAHSWRLWLLVGSRVNGTLGLMFDSDNPPHREGSVGFFDPPLPVSPVVQAAAQGQPIGQVPLAFLRTLVHEAGHAFNLFHPKHDIHMNPVGTTIMDQTGDVLQFSTVQNPFPCTSTMAFDEHCRTSLIHSPDPQVKPGWKEFGWGHSATFAGVAEPTDAFGLRSGDPAVEGLDLLVELPRDAQRADFVVATVTLRNTGEVPRRVTSRLNLAEGDLWFTLVDPAHRTVEVRDVVLACGERRFVELAPGEDISGQIQLLYTSTGFTFDQAGTYTLRAELDPGDEPGVLLQSAPAELVIRPAATEADLRREALATLDSVGLAFALGDPAADRAAEAPLGELVQDHSDTDIGVAAALTLLTGQRRRAEDRAAADDAATRALTDVLEQRDPATLARLAAAVASPVEPDVPAIAYVEDMLADRTRAAADAGTMERAEKILSDHLA